MAGERLDPTPSTVKAVWGRAAGHCCICKLPLVKEALDGVPYTSVGKIAHISAAEPGGARYDSSLTNEQRRAYSNLMLLCSNHHDEVDADEEKYTVVELVRIKKEHEGFVVAQFASLISALTYPDIEVIIQFLSETPYQSTDEDYSLTEIQEKIHKNELSSSVESFVRMGLTQSGSIRNYLNDHPDPRYEERLKSIFIQEYNLLKSRGQASDELFFSLVDRIKGPTNEIKRFATAIALVTYFFERCDIFEK